AKEFIDCSYEGDLMAMASVSYTVGRESNLEYNETYNGVQLKDKHQFPDGVDPYNVPGESASGFLWGISTQIPDRAVRETKKFRHIIFGFALLTACKTGLKLQGPRIMTAPFITCYSDILK
ncbi:MAG TPA: FAD-dependent oxidoreductase, partial [Puia sp.]|nr:FAD-dependent oxidoreductase [Puia sp.]